MRFFLAIIMLLNIACSEAPVGPIVCFDISDCPALFVCSHGDICELGGSVSVCSESKFTCGDDLLQCCSGDCHNGHCL